MIACESGLQAQSCSKLQRRLYPPYRYAHWSEHVAVRVQSTNEMGEKAETTDGQMDHVFLDKWSEKTEKQRRSVACIEIKGKARPEGKIELMKIPRQKVVSVIFDPDKVSADLVYYGLEAWLEYCPYKTSISVERSIQWKSLDESSCLGKLRSASTTKKEMRSAARNLPIRFLQVALKAVALCN